RSCQVQNRPTANGRSASLGRTDGGLRNRMTGVGVSVDMGTRWGSGSVRAGIMTVAGGLIVFGSVHWWVNTRTLVPLDTPLSLAPGHSQSDEFQLNVEGFFYIDVRFPYGGDCDGESLLTRRRLFVGKQMIPVSDTWNTEENGVVRGTSLGGFQGKP